MFSSLLDIADFLSECFIFMPSIKSINKIASIFTTPPPPPPLAYQREKSDVESEII